MLLALLACSGPPGPSPDTAGDGDTSAPDTAETHDSADIDTDTSADIDTDTSADTDTDTSPDTDTDTDTSPDADADGFNAIEHGGDDCDDTNPDVFPGAPEACDDVDQDCDGDPLAVGVCGELVDFARTGVQLLDGAPIIAIAGVGDLTGDGIGDVELVYRERIDGRAHNTLLVYPGGALPTSSWSGDPAEAYAAVYDLTTFATLLDTGDVDGDGADDLSLMGTAYQGSIAHLLGPLGAGVTTASAAIEVEVLHNGLWSSVWTGVDVDGDGAADIGAANDGHGDGLEVVTEVYYTIYFGGDWAASCDIQHRNGGVVSTAGAAGVLGDGDGDGLPELGFTVEQETWIVSGADARALCGAHVEDIALGSREESFEGKSFGEPLGDWDGDGYGEVGLSAYGGHDTGETAAWIFSAANLLVEGYDAADAHGSWVSPVDDTSVDALHAADLDGDGVSELLLSGYNERSVIRGGTIPAPGDPLPDRRLRFPDTDWWCGSYGACSDITGDGREDLLFWDPEPDTESMDAWVVPGFDIPWDDATAW